MAPDKKSALDVFKRLYNACDRFLAGVSLELVGAIPKDMTVRKSVIQQQPFCHVAAGSEACKALTTIAQKIQTWDITNNLDGNIKFFWKKLLFKGQEPIN